MNKKNELTQLAPWQALSAHYHDISSYHMREWFHQEPTRSQDFRLHCDKLLLDYSRNRINRSTINHLCALADAVSLKNAIHDLFSGNPINTTEKRAALHTALRDTTHQPVFVSGHNVAPAISDTLKQMQAFTRRIHDGDWRGVTGKPIQHIVNIGIGGSHLGPQMACHALKEFSVSRLRFYFISTIDKALRSDVLEHIDPETTLFIISSKTFTTLETLTNARTLLSWMDAQLGKAAVAKHFVAITANTPAALALGIPESNIFSIWEWVNGRYSIWSAIGLPLMLQIGCDGFDEFLAGAYALDQHFKQMPFEHNMPVILALLSVWYQNFFHTHAHAIVPYAYRLRKLIAYLQQAEMESNGKNINKDGHPIAYATGPILFGEEGSNGQHSYHQLLHQGQQLIPADFILVGKAEKMLLASGLSQAQALMQGKTYEEAYHELLSADYTEEAARELAKYKVIPGNRPSNIIYLNQLTPRSLGNLLALYEHKIFVEGVIWHINSFDQWGVELGKQLLPDILQQLQGNPTVNMVEELL